MVFGTFDLLHEGHKHFLKDAKDYGDELIVIIARDENVKYIKNAYPHDDENKRKQNVESLAFVDRAILGELDDRYKAIEELKPDVICIGYDQRTGKLEEKLKEKGLKTILKKIKPYNPQKYKTSIKKKRALFVGRFQPLHKGHLKVIKDTSKRYREIAIVIGSANKDDDKNPFNAEHRKNMIIETLKKEGIENYSIFIVPDIPDDNKWPAHVEKFTGKFDLVITRNDLVKRLFENAGKEVEYIPELYYDISSTDIREKLKKSLKWENFVPKEVAEYIKNKLIKIKKQ